MPDLAKRHVPVPDGATCFECDAPALHMHHVVPYAAGGRRALPLCEACHGVAHGLQMAGHGAAIRSSLATKRARGEMTGAARYGQRVGADCKTLEIDPGEQAIIARAVELSTSGETVREVVSSLAAEGIVGRTGKALTLAAVHAILTKHTPAE